jgi:hypothetical protein
LAVKATDVQLSGCASGGSSDDDEEEKERAKEKAKGKGKGPRRYSETEDEFKPEESDEEAAEGEYGTVFTALQVAQLGKFCVKNHYEI